MPSSLRLGAFACLSILAACTEARTPAVYGAECSATIPCGGDLLCLSAATFPGGYCTSECGSSPCGLGSVCEGSAPALCLLECTSHDECRAGYQCWRGACRPGCAIDPGTCGGAAACVEGRCVGFECTSDEVCGPGRRCASNRCISLPSDGGVPTPDGAVLIADGQPCIADLECESSICLPPERGGVCTRSCSVPADCLAAVDFDAACAPALRGGAARTLCVPYNLAGAGNAASCTSDSQCAASTCIAGQCTSVCADADDCLLGQVCGMVPYGAGAFRGCGYEAGSGIAELDLGDRELMAGSGTEPLVFATPPDSVSITLRARTLGGDPLPISFFDVNSPERRVLFRLEDIYAWRDPLIRWLPLNPEEAIAMLVPNTTADRVAYVAGRHDVRVVAISRRMGDPGRTRIHVDALIKRAPGGTVSSGAIDLDVYLVGVGVSAAAAPADTRVQSALSRFGVLMSRAGISLGEVGYFDVSAAAATEFQVIDSTDGAESELFRMFRLSSGRTGNRLSIFLVRSINGAGEGFNTLGVAGGVPGPSGIHGTGHSGVVVAFSSSVVGPSGALAGHVMAHEVGHFLGLYHVTESRRPCGPSEDPSTAMCAPFGGTDTIGDTAYGDDTNLMHWSLVGSGSNDRLSAGQSFVLLRSALVR